MRKVLKKNLGLTLVVALITALGGVALIVRSAGAAVIVDKGFDTFTTPDNAQTYDDFSSHPIPAGFFGAGSEEFKGRVTFKGGAPIDPARFGSADTVIERKDPVQVPGDTTLDVVGISFVSVSPITIKYANGSSTTCNVSVGKSAVTPSIGTMHFNPEGTFTSSLKIYARYGFNCSNGSYNLDAGAAGRAINLSSTNGTWSQSGRVTVINPGSEQDLLASHNVTPAPTPCRTPHPQPTATVVPGGPQPIDKSANVDSSAARSAASTNVAVTPCLAEATLDKAVESQP